MPIYEYKCNSCGATKEVVRGIKEPESRPKCENCWELGNPYMERTISSGTSFILKGGGWAKDGYK